MSFFDHLYLKLEDIVDYTEFDILVDEESEIFVTVSGYGKHLNFKMYEDEIIVTINGLILQQYTYNIQHDIVEDQNSGHSFKQSLLETCLTKFADELKQQVN